MSTERREMIIAILRKERMVTIEQLANTLGCSKRTIRYDIEELTLDFPIESVRGRYGGGVKLLDWYQPPRNTLCPEQIQALRNAMANTNDPKAQQALGSIIDQFGPRQR